MLEVLGSGLDREHCVPGRERRAVKACYADQQPPRQGKLDRQKGEFAGHIGLDAASHGFAAEGKLVLENGVDD